MSGARRTTNHDGRGVVRFSGDRRSWAFIFSHSLCLETTLFTELLSQSHRSPCYDAGGLPLSCRRPQGLTEGLTSSVLTEVTLLLPDLHAYDTAASAGCASKLERAARRPRQGAGLLPLGEEVLSTARARRASVRTVCSRTRSVGGRGGPAVRRSRPTRAPRTRGILPREKVLLDDAGAAPRRVRDLAQGPVTWGVRGCCGQVRDGSWVTSRVSPRCELSNRL